jgi:ferritin
MIGDKLRDEINDQIKHELYSAYIYLSMAAWCADRNLTGFAHWMRMQSREEVGHAMRLYEFLLERGGRVELQPLDGPPADFGSALEVMEKSLEHERFISSRIHSLYELAQQEGDYAAQVMLQWFVTEQVEEEASVEEIVERMRMFGAEGPALLIMDQRLGARTGGAE